MSLIVSATPDGWDLVSSGDDDKKDLAKRLQSAYEDRFAVYERELTSALNLIGMLAPNLAPANYPALGVVLDGDEEEVVFDFSLYERLLEIYVFEGWAGIVAVANELDKHLSPADVDSPSAGVRANEATLWVPVRSFFQFTRGFPILLIREALIAIERKAASVISVNLNLSAQAITKAWQDLGVVRSYREEYEVSPDGEGYWVKREFFRFDNRSLSNALFAALTDAVRQKFAYEDLLQRLTSVREMIESTRKPSVNARHRGSARRKQKREQELQRLKQNQVELQRLTDQAQAFLAGMLSAIHLNCPFGLLVLDGLAVGFAQEDMEAKLGLALWRLYEKIDEIGTGVDPASSRVAAAIPELAAGAFLDWRAVQRWAAPPAWVSRGLERVIVDAALHRLDGDPAWTPMAHEATWYRLVESGAIAKDSFEYVVYAHYVLELMDELEARRADEEKFEKFWKGFAKLSATLALLLLVTPAAPALQAVSAVANLVLLAHTIHSAVSSLTKLDQALAAQLIQPDAFALENLAAIGELSAVRAEAVAQMTTEILIELALLAAAGEMPLVKKLLHVRGYYYDVEMLLSDG